MVVPLPSTIRKLPHASIRSRIPLGKVFCPTRILRLAPCSLPRAPSLFRPTIIHCKINTMTTTAMPPAEPALLSDDSLRHNSQMETYQPGCVEDGSGDCAPRELHKPDGRIIPLSPTCVLKAAQGHAVVLDVRDPNEVRVGKGGRSLEDNVTDSHQASLVLGGCTDYYYNIPINVDGKPQSSYSTSLAEFQAKLRQGGLELTDERKQHTAFIAHCTGGGRASKAVHYLQQLGCQQVYNGGSPEAVRQALEEAAASKKPSNDGCTDCS